MWSLLAGAVLTGSTVHAANATWDGSVNGDWTEAGNWLEDAAPGAVGTTTNNNVALFNGLVANQVVTIDDTRNLLTLQFDVNAGAYVFNGGPLRLSSNSNSSGFNLHLLSGSSATQTFNTPIHFSTNSTNAILNNSSASSGAHLTINGSVTGRAGNTTSFTLGGIGNGSINGVIADGEGGTLSLSRNNTVNWSGTWALLGANTYTGTSSITSGNVIINTIRNVGEGASSLGNPELANSVINLGSATTGDPKAIMIYVGDGDSTDRVVRLAGNTRGGSIQSDGTGALIFTSALDAASGAKPLVLKGSNTDNNEFRGAITNGAGAVNLVKSGTGTWVISGSNTYTNQTNVNAGLLRLNYTLSNDSKLSDTARLLLSGGTLELAGGSHAETVSATQVGNADFQQTGGGLSNIIRSSGTGTVNLNTITRGAGGALNIAADNLVTADNPGANGIIGGWMTVAGENWAVNSTAGDNGAVIGLTSYTALAAGTGTDTVNSILSASQTQTGNRNTNTLKIGATAEGQSLDLGGTTLSMTGAGVLFASDEDFEIKNGTFRGATSSAAPGVFIHHYADGVLTISANIVNNGSQANSIAVSGTGKVVLSGTNTNTGVTYVNGATVSISNNANLGAVATGASVVLSNGTLQVTEDVTLDNGGVNARNLFMQSGGGTILVDPNRTLTVTGVVTVAQNTVVLDSALIKTGAGTLRLNNTNTYTGKTFVNAGSLRVDGSTVTSVETIVNNTGTLTGIGSVGNTTVNSGGTISPGNGAGSISTQYTKLNGGAKMLLQLASDTGVAGTNWDKLAVTGTLDLTSLTSSSRFVLRLQTLTGGGAAGALDAFDKDADHVWSSVITTGGLAGTFAPNLFGIDDSGFANALNGYFTFVRSGQNFDLMYTVPEPASLSLVLLGAAAILRRRRRQA